MEYDCVYFKMKIYENLTKNTKQKKEKDKKETLK
jgi:hypothetical protein